MPYNSDGEWIVPTTSGPTTSKVGDSRGTYAHGGIDKDGYLGEPIPWDLDEEGEVVSAETRGGYGNLVVVRTPSGRERSYAHLNKYHVKVGDRIKKGQVFAEIGNTGKVRKGKGGDGSHLHYEERQDPDAALLAKYGIGQGTSPAPEAAQDPDEALLAKYGIGTAPADPAPTSTQQPVPTPTHKGTEGQTSPDGKFKWSNGRWIDNTGLLPSQLNPAGVDPQQLVVDPNNPQQTVNMETGLQEMGGEQAPATDPNAGQPLPRQGEQRQGVVGDVDGVTHAIPGSTYQSPSMSWAGGENALRGHVDATVTDKDKPVALEQAKMLLDPGYQAEVRQQIANQANLTDGQRAAMLEEQTGLEAWADGVVKATAGDQELDLVGDPKLKASMQAKMASGEQFTPEEVKAATLAAARSQGLVSAKGDVGGVINADGSYNEVADEAALHEQFLREQKELSPDDPNVKRNLKYEQWNRQRSFDIPHSDQLTLGQANNALRQFIFGGDPELARRREAIALAKGIIGSPVSILGPDGAPVTEADWAGFRDQRSVKATPDNPSSWLNVRLDEQAVAARKQFNEAGFDEESLRELANSNDQTQADKEKYQKQLSAFRDKDKYAAFTPYARRRLAQMGQAQRMKIADEEEWILDEARRISLEVPEFNVAAEALGLGLTDADYRNPGFTSKGDRPMSMTEIGLLNLFIPGAGSALQYAGADGADLDRAKREAFQQFSGFVGGLTNQWLTEYDPAYDKAFQDLDPNQQNAFLKWRDNELMVARSLGYTGNIAAEIFLLKGAGGTVGALANASKFGKFLRFTEGASRIINKGGGVGASMVEATFHSAMDNARKQGKPTLEEWANGGGWDPLRDSQDNLLRYFKDVVGDIPSNFLQFQGGRYFGQVADKLAKLHGVKGIKAVALGKVAEAGGEIAPEAAEQLAREDLDVKALLINGGLGLLLGGRSSSARRFVKDSQSGNIYEVTMDGQLVATPKERVGAGDLVVPSGSILGGDVSIDEVAARLSGTQRARTQGGGGIARLNIGAKPAIATQAAEDQGNLDAVVSGVQSVTDDNLGYDTERPQTIFGGQDELEYAAERAKNFEEELTKNGPARIVGQAELGAKALNAVADEIEAGLLGRKEVKPTNSVLGLNDTEAQPAIKPAKGKKAVADVITAAIDKVATLPDGTIDNSLKVRLVKEVGSVLSEDLGPKELAKAVRTLAQKATTEAESMAAEFTKPENQERRYNKELADATQEVERLAAERETARAAQKPYVDAVATTRQDLEATQADLDSVKQSSMDALNAAHKELAAARKRHADTYNPDLAVDQKQKLNQDVERAEANLAQVKEQGKADIDFAKEQFQAAKNADTEAMKAVNESGKAYKTIDQAYGKAVKRQDKAYANREGFIKEQKQKAEQEGAAASVKETTAPKSETAEKSVSDRKAEQKSDTKAPATAASKEVKAPAPVDTKDGRQKILSDPKQVKSLIKQAQEAIKEVTDNPKVKADNKGASIRLDGTTPTTGYAVAIDQQFEHVVPEGTDEAKAIADYLARVDVRKELAKRTNAVIGMWRNPELNNALTLDISEVYEDRATAERKGEARSQWGYHDIAKGLRVDSAGDFESGYTALEVRKTEEALYKHLTEQQTKAGNKYVPEEMRIASKVYSYLFASLAKRDGLSAEDVIKLHWQDGLLGIRGKNQLAMVGADGKSLELEDLVDEDGNVILYMRNLPPEAISLLASNVVQDDINSEDPALIREVVPKLNALVPNKVHLPKGRDLSKPDIAAKYTKESTDQFVENTYESVMDFFKHYLPQNNGEFVARAFHWYGPGVEEAMKEMAKFYPELALGEDGKPVDYYAHTMVGTMLGITSAGVSPDQALDATVPMYEDYRAAREQAVKDGKDPDLVPIPLVDVTKFVNTNSNFRDGNGIKWNIEVALPGGGYGMASYTGAVTINGIAAKKFGGSMSKTLDWLYSRHPVDEIVAASNLTKSTSLDLPDESNPYGAYVLGAKIGAFVANIHGHFDELTPDIWMYREWRGALGTLEIRKGQKDKDGKDTEDTGLPLNETERRAMRIGVDNLAKKLEDTWRSATPEGKMMRGILGKPQKITRANIQATLWYMTQQTWARQGSGSIKSRSFHDAAMEIGAKYKDRVAEREEGRKAVQAAWLSGLYHGSSPERQALEEGQRQFAADPDKGFKPPPLGDPQRQPQKDFGLDFGTNMVKALKPALDKQAADQEKGKQQAQPTGGFNTVFPAKKEQYDKNYKVTPASWSAPSVSLQENLATVQFMIDSVAEMVARPGITVKSVGDGYAVMLNNGSATHSVYDTKEEAQEQADLLKSERTEFNQGPVRLEALRLQKAFVIEAIHKATGKPATEIEAQMHKDAAAHAKLLPIRKALFMAQRNQGVQAARENFNTYAAKNKIRVNSEFSYVVASEQVGMEVADAFDALVHSPNDPEVLAAYDAFAADTKKQWDHLVESGVVFEPWTQEGQPYANSAEMMADVAKGHLSFFLGGDMPADHPSARYSGVEINGTKLTHNDVFRAVHDYFGHSVEGLQFGPRGEYNATRAHAQLYSREAMPAMLSETLGQNSWVNFGKHLRGNASDTVIKKGEPGYIPVTERPYAEQKAALLPNTVLPAEFKVGYTREQLESSLKFKEWFGDSKVVGEDGRPLVVYHMTKANFDVFDPSRTIDIGIHFGTQEQANARGGHYGSHLRKPHLEIGQNIQPAYLSIQNPLHVGDIFSVNTGDWVGKLDHLEDAGLELDQALRDAVDDIDKNSGFSFEKGEKKFWNLVRPAMEAQGFDGFIYENEQEADGTSYAVLNPNQIKSALGNTGTFSRTDPRTLFQPEQIQDNQVLGATHLDTSTKAPALMDLFRGAGIHTILHEGAHGARRFLSDPDMAVAEGWVTKVTKTPIINGQWQTVHEEAFARGFEQYLLEGKLLDGMEPEMERVFEAIKQIFIDIYKGHQDYINKGQVDDLAGPLDDNIRGVFARLLGIDTSPLSPEQDMILDAARAEAGLVLEPVAVFTTDQQADARDMMLTYCRWDFRRMPIVDQRGLLEDIFEVQQNKIQPMSQEEVLGPVFAGRLSEFRESGLPKNGLAALQRRFAKRLTYAAQLDPSDPSQAREILEVDRFGGHAFSAMYANRRVAKRRPDYILYTAAYHPDFLLALHRSRATLAGINIKSTDWKAKEAKLARLIAEAPTRPTFISVTYNQGQRVDDPTLRKAYEEARDLYDYVLSVEGTRNRFKNARTEEYQARKLMEHWASRPESKAYPEYVKRHEVAQKRLSLAIKAEGLSVSDAARLLRKAERKMDSGRILAQEQQGLTYPLHLTHYSTTAGLSMLDPNQMGTGARSSKTERDSAVKRSYFYITGKGKPEPVVVKDPKIRYRYNAMLSPEQPLYDLSTDPQGIIAATTKANDGIYNPDNALAAIRDAGFAGYHASRAGTNANIVALFNPQLVEEADYETGNPKGNQSLFMAQKNRPRYIATHAMRLGTLMKSLEQGYIPAPSVAVQDFFKKRRDGGGLLGSSFGDVTIVLKPEFVDPASGDINLYNRDAYTPRYRDFGGSSSNKSIVKANPLTGDRIPFIPEEFRHKITDRVMDSTSAPFYQGMVELAGDETGGTLGKWLRANDLGWLTKHYAAAFMTPIWMADSVVVKSSLLRGKDRADESSIATAHEKVKKGEWRMISMQASKKNKFYILSDPETVRKIQLDPEGLLNLALRDREDFVILKDASAFGDSSSFVLASLTSVVEGLHQENYISMVQGQAQYKTDAWLEAPKDGANYLLGTARESFVFDAVDYLLWDMSNQAPTGAGDPYAARFEKAFRQGQELFEAYKGPMWSKKYLMDLFQTAWRRHFLDKFDGKYFNTSTGEIVDPPKPIDVEAQAKAHSAHIVQGDPRYMESQGGRFTKFRREEFTVRKAKSIDEFHEMGRATRGGKSGARDDKAANQSEWLARILNTFMSEVGFHRQLDADAMDFKNKVHAYVDGNLDREVIEEAFNKLIDETETAKAVARAGGAYNGDPGSADTEDLDNLSSLHDDKDMAIKAMDEMAAALNAGVSLANDYAEAKGPKPILPQDVLAIMVGDDDFDQVAKALANSDFGTKAEVRLVNYSVLDTVSQKAAMAKAKEVLKPFHAKGIQTLFQEAHRQTSLNMAQPTSNAADIAAAAQEIADTFMETERASIGTIIGDVRKSMMLSSLKTHLRNIIGNLAYQGIEEISRVPAVMFDVLASLRYGQRSTVLNPKDLGKAIWHAFSNRDGETAVGQGGLTRAWREIMGVNTALDTEEATQGRTHDHGWNIENPAVVLLEKITQISFRFLAAEDAMFNAFAMRRSLLDMASTAVKNKEVASHAEFFASLDDETAMRAYKDALVATFNSSNLASTAISGWKTALELKGYSPVKLGLDLLVPFDRTPTNLILRTLDYTPVGLFTGSGGRDEAVYRVGKGPEGTDHGVKIASSLHGKFKQAEMLRRVNKTLDSAFTKQELQWVQKEMGKQVGRGLIGTIIILGAMMGAKGLLKGAFGGEDDDDEQGRISGMGSGDDKLRNRTEGQGRNSIRIGNKWYSIDGMPPIGNLLLLGASINESMYRGETAGEGGMSLLAEVGRQALQLPVVRGFTDLGGALADEDGYKTASFGGRIVASFIPAIVRDMAAFKDRKERETGKGLQGIVDNIKMGIPGKLGGIGRESLPVATDFLGREAPEETMVQSGVGAFLDIFRTTESKSSGLDLASVGKGADADKVFKELSRHDISLNKPVKEEGETDEDYNKRVTVIGTAIYRSLQAEVESQRYKDMAGLRDKAGKPMQAEQLKTIMEKAKGRADKHLDRILKQRGKAVPEKPVEYPHQIAAAKAKAEADKRKADKAAKKAATMPSMPTMGSLMKPKKPEPVKPDTLEGLDAPAAPRKANKPWDFMEDEGGGWQ